MGCLCQKSEWEVIEEYIEKSLEKSNLSPKYCEKISKSIHRTTLHFHLTKVQLTESLGYLKLTLSDDLEKILKNFLEYPRECKFIKKQRLRGEYGQDYNTQMYSVKKLSTFGILLGKGNTEEKSKCLFSVYDIDASNNLSKWEITVMINDIMEIALEKMLNITEDYFPEQIENIENYKRKLASMKENFVNYFKFLLLDDDKKEMTGEEFVLAMKKNDMRWILDAKALRLAMVNNYLKCVEMFQEVKKEFSDFRDKNNPGSKENLTNSNEVVKSELE